MAGPAVASSNNGRSQRVGVLVGSWPLGMPNDPTRFYLSLAGEVERLGYDMLFTGDHFFAAGPSVDSLILLAAIAARTERLVVGSGVLLVALREPVALAKQAATIDLVSGGRFILGVGVGGEFKDEWAALGVPLVGRGRRVDEYLSLVQQLWRGTPVRHRGELRTVEGVVGSPVPTRPSGPPIWIGGRSDAALSRAARHDGWIAYAVSPRRLRESGDRVREQAGQRAEAIRIVAVVFSNVHSVAATARASAEKVLGVRYRQDFAAFLNAFCAVGQPESVQARIEEFMDSGADDVLICPQCPADEFMEQVQRTVETVLLPMGFCTP